jgi:hypothetical protein
MCFAMCDSDLILALRMRPAADGAIPNSIDSSEELETGVAKAYVVTCNTAAGSKMTSYHYNAANYLTRAISVSRMICFLLTSKI